MTADEVFNRYGIRKTMIREAILIALLERNEGLTYAELTNRIGSNNKANIQRALNFFQIMGFVHKVMFSGHKLRYYYSGERSRCKIYFTCMQCHRAYIFNTEMPAIELPGGKQIKKAEFIISGTCSECNPED